MSRDKLRDNFEIAITALETLKGMKTDLGRQMMSSGMWTKIETIIYQIYGSLNDIYMLMEQEAEILASLDRDIKELQEKAKVLPKTKPLAREDTVINRLKK